MTSPNETQASQRPFLDIASSDFARLTAHIDCRDIDGKTILVSGATGFFGAWILALFEWLRKTRNVQFRVLAISRNPQSFRSKHPWIDDVEWLQWITGDIQDFAFPEQAVDYVIHAATDTSAPAGRSPALLLNSIVRGTERVLACAKACGAKRVLLVSSGGAYGGQSVDTSRLLESSRNSPSTMDVGSAYGEGKRVMELLGAIHAHENACAVVIARCFAFLGAGLPLDGHFAIGNFIRDALTQDRIVIRGDGKGVRSYLYAADLAVWLMHLLLNGQNRGIYNVGSDQEVTIAELARQVISTLAPAKTVVVEGASNSPGAGNRYVPSIDQARSQLGLDVWTALPLAILNTALWSSKK
ncbi:NAD-dependent epimerase/dehydratase family protein [Paraburkholderia elongata]|uniref:NAD-dependent epimerase/dehydratase family protein n=1 Tax=Paraburkholderia elongata TaxID=2675747 RepID=A0A972P1V2_9BURK|nr:NAD(P)-dependent oxidoreductase [Paraburkholderia elongata]NPT62604.1 NAD-dependent epimerase/dehydratase family protein [Paraburkholderia elongata]